MLTAMKEEQGYWNRSIIIRLFEMHGKPTEATVTFPIEIQASETDLLEQEIQKVDVDDQKIQVKMKPFEIKTIKLDPKGGWVGW
jgi:alpha-mannosidase